MPYKNHKDKLKHSYNYRHTRSDQYHKWLYERRKLRLDKAAMYEEVLEKIAGFETDLSAAQAASDTLESANYREREVGNRFDHEKDQPYYKED